MDLQAAKMLGAGIAMFALLGVGIGLGNIFSSLLDAIARNPNAEPVLFKRALFGFAVTEAIALFALVIAFIIMFV